MSLTPLGFSNRRRAGLAAVIVSALVSISAVSPDRLRATVEWLSDPARDGRQSQSPGAAATAEYLVERFSGLGLEPELQDIGLGRRNVIARLGNHARHIIVGAHYDGQGRGYPSASDNAAGVAVLLELAQDLREAELPASVVFIAFDDEERGLNGSRFYAENPRYPLAETMAVVILDTMGRSFVDLDRWSLIVFGAELSPELNSIVSARSNMTMVQLGTDLLGPRSDFAPFAARDVPYLFFTNATHVDYHGPGDTPEAIRYDRLQEDAETIRGVVVDIAGLSSPPRFRDQAVYPAGESGHLIAYMDAIEREHPEVAAAYAALFDDLRRRLSAEEPSREALRLATSVMLSAATPRLSFFSLMYLIGPFYEAEGETETALSAYREALEWAPNEPSRGSVREKMESLAPQ